MGPYDLAALAMVCALAGWAIGAWRDRARRNAIKLYEHAAIRLSEAHSWRDRDRTSERRERDRLIQQRQESRLAFQDLAELLRVYLITHSMLDAERAVTAAERARETLASDWGVLGPPEGRRPPEDESGGPL